MSQKLIVHVSEVDIFTTSGMGRVEYYWKKAFENAGFQFIHIGPAEVGKLAHKMLFGLKAYRYFKRLRINPEFFIVHEAASGFFVKRGIPCFLESHGVERRYWEQILNNPGQFSTRSPLPLKTRLLYPLWRLSVGDKGLKYADKLLLINNDDANYVKHRFGRVNNDIFIFRNGVSPMNNIESTTNETPFTILFNASWIQRNGIDVLVKAAGIIHSKGLKIKYILAGTGKNEQTVLNDWPQEIKPSVKVISHFDPTAENSLLQACSLFVLPSYSEGQPLSLLQAMAVGTCCITTACCGQKDIIKKGITGLLFEPGDSNSLAQLITDCYNNPAMVKQIAMAARKDTETCTWENVTYEVVNFVTKAKYGAPRLRNHQFSNSL